MVDDIIHFMNHIGINKAIWLGHSYGGKIAYLGGLMYPQFIESVIALDVSPISYESRNDLYIRLLKTFQKVPNLEFKFRKDIESYIIEQVPEITQFEATFLTSTLQPVSFKQDNLKWIWKMNVDAMLDQLENITSFDSLQICWIVRYKKG